MNDLQVISNDLQDMVSTLAVLDEKSADLLTDGEEYEEEATLALCYHARATQHRQTYSLHPRPFYEARRRPRSSCRDWHRHPRRFHSTSSREPLRVALPKL